MPRFKHPLRLMMPELATTAEHPPGRSSVKWLIAALGYLALGALGISFAIAPGYASPIFPAAGFAVAILLWSDRRAWPGIWLGSFVLNLGIGWLHGDLSWRSVPIAAGIAGGSMAQGLFACWLVARCAECRWQTMEADRDILRTLALAGPAACLISATTGVTVLYATGVVSATEYLYAWFNWWSGDTLGVLVMLPITLALLYRRSPPWSSRMATLVLPMLFALVLVGSAFYAVSQWEFSRQKLSIQAHGEALANRLAQRLIAHQEALAALQRLIEVTPDMSYRQFGYFTRITLKDNPDIFALSVNPYITAAQRPVFERDMARKTAMPEFAIKERDSERRLIRAANRPDYVAVGYIAPLQGNLAAVGFDINSEPIRHDAIQRAMQSGELAITAPIQLVQENRQRVGVLLLKPTYPEREVSSAAIKNNAVLTGFAVGVVKVDEMVEIATREIAIPGLVFQVDDAAAPRDKAAVFRSGSAASVRDDSYVWQKSIAIADRQWTLTLTPTTDYLQRQRHWAALAVGAAGLTLAALLQMLLLGSTGRTAIVQRKVREQTVDLELARNAAEKASQLLNEAVSSIAQGFTIYDENDRLVHCNETYLQFYETSRDLIVIGATFEEIIRRGAERGQYTVAIGRVDEWVAERVRQHQNANGEVIEQQLTDGRWLMIVEYKTPSGYIAGNRIDITARRRAEAVICDRTEQLNAIFTLSPDGFISFNQLHRVKYVSPAFSSLTGLEEAQVVGLDEAAFTEKLASRCIPTARFRGVDTLLLSGAAGESSEARHQRFELSGPGGRVLEVSLRRSDAETVSQILCFRDITHETEVDRMKSEFLSTAAHELRTPMASIYGFAEVLLMQELDEATRHELVDIIYRQSELMAKIINELLDLARIEARRGKDFVLEAVVLDQLVTEAVSGYKVPEDRAAPIMLPPAMPMYVKVDRSKMQQAVTNLISNAYKYSPGGGAVSIGFVVAADDGRVGIQVSDHGIGMTPAQLARICERFYRADTSGKILGTGLGMSIVKEIVELHGGELEFASKVGAGTTVTVWLPGAGIPSNLTPHGNLPSATGHQGTSS